MHDPQHPDPGDVLGPRAANDDMPVIETPVIDIQDLEYNPGPGTRVNNKGVKVEPQVDELPAVDELPIIEEVILGEEDEEEESVREAIAKLEESIAKMPPG